MKKFSIVFLAGLRMHIINEEDLYLIGQYYKFGSAILNSWYQLNQKSYDYFYTLDGQKIKQLPKQDFEFRAIHIQKLKQALINVRDNISSHVLKSIYDWYSYQRIIQLSLNPKA